MTMSPGTRFAPLGPGYRKGTYIYLYINKDHKRIMVDPMFIIVQTFRLF